MRKKFLKNAAAFSIAAACIMSGLVPASIVAPVEVAAAVVSPADKSEEELKTLMTSIINEVIKSSGQVSKDGTSINLKKDNSVQFGAPVSYTVGEETLEDVTITADTSSDKLKKDSNGEIVLADGVLNLSDEDLKGGITVTVKASVEKDSSTVETDAVTITLSRESSAPPVGDDTPLGKAGIASVTVDSNEGLMEVSGVTGTKEVLVGIGKVNKNKKTINVSSWATYEDNGNATVDLSKLSNVKDNYIVLTTPGKDVAIIKIPASDKSIKAKFSVKDGLQVGTAATGSASAAALTADTVGKYEYRTSYSTWNSLPFKNDAVDLSLYQEEGAKLFVRLKATGAEEATASTIDASETWTYGNQKDIAVYKVATLPGKETKVSVPAKAKGPKLTADYAKGTVKFPRNSEFRLATATDIYLNNGKLVESPTEKKTVAEIYKMVGLAEDQAAEVDIEVRTKANDRKAASKWGRLTVSLPAKFEEGAIKEGVSDTPIKAEDVEKDKEKEFGGHGVKDSELKETENGNNVLKIEYSGTEKNPTLKITNNGEKAYEFVKESATATKPGDSAKAVKAAKGKTITIRSIKDGEIIFVRAAGDKKSMEWVSDYAKLGVIDVPKKVVGTGTGGGSVVTPDPATRKVASTDLEDFATDMLITELTLPAAEASKTEVISLAKDAQKPVVIGDEGNSYTAKDTKEITGIKVTVSVTGDGDENADGNVFNTDTSQGLKYAAAAPAGRYTGDVKTNLVVTISISHPDVQNPVTQTLTLKTA